MVVSLADLTVVIPLNNCNSKGLPFGFVHFQDEFPRCSDEITSAIATAVALALFIVLMPGRLGRLVGLYP